MSYIPAVNKTGKLRGYRSFQAEEPPGGVVCDPYLDYYPLCSFSVTAGSMRAKIRDLQTGIVSFEFSCDLAGTYAGVGGIAGAPADGGCPPCFFSSYETEVPVTAIHRGKFGFESKYPRIGHLSLACTLVRQDDPVSLGSAISAFFSYQEVFGHAFVPCTPIPVGAPQHNQNNNYRVISPQVDLTARDLANKSNPLVTRDITPGIDYQRRGFLYTGGVHFEKVDGSPQILEIEEDNYALEDFNYVPLEISCSFISW